MRRAVRVLIFGPIFLLALCGFVLMWPVVRLFEWVFDLPHEPYIREVAHEALGTIWDNS